MKSVLYKLYDGELSRTNLGFSKGTPYARAFESVTDSEQALLASLSGAQKELFQAHMTAVEKLHAIARREDYASGFQTGARIMAAVMDTDIQDLHHSRM